MRCLRYRLIRIHRKFTSAYLLCDKASLNETLVNRGKEPMGNWQSCWQGENISLSETFIGNHLLNWNATTKNISQKLKM